MYHFQSNVESLRTFSSPVMSTKLDSYRVDEGYSEDTRSQDGSEPPILMDMHEGGRDGSLHLQPSMAATIEQAVRGLSEYERSGMPPRVTPSTMYILTVRRNCL